MANNKNTKKKQEVENEVDTKKLGKRGILTIVISCIALLGIILGTIFGIVACKKKNAGFDFMKSDLSAYIDVPADFYKNYSVSLNIPEVTDTDVNEEIIKVLCKNKITPDGPIYSLANQDISIGDVVAIYYRGYTVEDGMKKYFDGGCNFGESKFDNLELEIGSGTFVPGFESGLIGKNGKDYATLTRKENGTVSLGDIITLTYSVARADGTTENSKTVVLDLADPTLDERWGDGFTKFIVGQKVGVKFASGTNDWLIVDTVVDNATGQDAYTNMLVSTACRVSEGEKLIVEANFPNDYKSEDLRGKKGYFEVYIVSSRNYTEPTLDDAFVTDTLKISADELAKYDGANLVEKYKAKVKADLNAARDEKIDLAIETSFWDQILAATTVKQFPETKVVETYNSAVAEMQAVFESGYNTYYNNDFDLFARAYLELGTNADWTATVRADAEDSVKRRLVFYYLIRSNPELVPDDAKYNELYEMIFNTYLQEYLSEYNITESSANYEQQLALAKETIKNSYAEEYWNEFVLYEYAIDKIIANAKIV